MVGNKNYIFLAYHPGWSKTKSSGGIKKGLSKKITSIYKENKTLIKDIDNKLVNIFINNINKI